MSTRETLRRLAAREGLEVTPEMSNDDVADLLVTKWRHESIPGVVALIEIGGESQYETAKNSQE